MTAAEIALLLLRAYVATLEYVTTLPPDQRAAHDARIAVFGELFDKVTGDLKTVVDRIAATRAGAGTSPTGTASPTK